MNSVLGRLKGVILENLPNSFSPDYTRFAGTTSLWGVAMVFERLSRAYYENLQVGESSYKDPARGKELLERSCEKDRASGGC